MEGDGAEVERGGNTAIGSLLQSQENERAREIYHQRKEALKKPIEMPELNLEMSEYEKIRVRNIKEREEALTTAGFSWRLD